MPMRAICFIIAGCYVTALAIAPSSVIIPAGTAHAGTTAPNLKVYSIKTPPQAPTDVHPVP